MDMRKYGGGPLRPEDVRDAPREEKIIDVSINERFDLPVLHFESGCSTLVNNTNCRALNRAYGHESNNWIDQTVELSLGHYVDSKDGQEKETIAIRPISARQPSADNGGNKAPPRPERRDDLEDEIPF